MTLIPVIARSKATWQSIPTPSLRGAKRRGNPYFKQCRTLDGLLRLRLAMTVGWLAMTLIPVIARSKATWQSIFQAVPDARWIASPSARNDGGVARNDGGVLAVILIPVIARSAATWQSIPTPSLRGAKRRGNPYPPVIARSKATWQSTPTLSLRGAKPRGNPYLSSFHCIYLGSVVSQLAKSILQNLNF